MTKETLTREGIQHDLKKQAEQLYHNKSGARLVIAIPFTIWAVAIIIFFGFKAIPLLISALLLLVAAYQYYGYFTDWKRYGTHKKMILEAIHRADFSISVQKLSHISRDTVYEPYEHTTFWHGTHAHAAKETTVFCFEGGDSWRLPFVSGQDHPARISRHYSWSREFHLSSKGLLNVSIPGNDFYYVSLQSDYEISYVYPCKLFTLDKSLNI